MRKKIAIAIVLASCLAFVFFVSRQRNTESSVRIEHKSDRLRVDYLDSEMFSTTLRDQGIIDNNLIKKVEVVFVDKEIENVVFTQSDVNGKLLISSKFDIGTDGVATVTIFPSAELLSKKPDEIQRWLDDEFWRSAKILVKRTTKSDTAVVKQVQVFKVLQ